MLPRPQRGTTATRHDRNEARPQRGTTATRHDREGVPPGPSAGKPGRFLDMRRVRRSHSLTVVPRCGDRCTNQEERLGEHGISPGRSGFRKLRCSRVQAGSLTPSSRTQAARTVGLTLVHGPPPFRCGPRPPRVGRPIPCFVAPLPQGRVSGACGPAGRARPRTPPRAQGRWRCGVAPHPPWPTKAGYAPSPAGFDAESARTTCHRSALPNV